MNSELSELEEQAKKIAEELKAKKKELKRKSKRSIKWVANTWNRIKKNPELVTIPFVLLVWIISPAIMRIFDPSAGGFNTGYLQIPVNSILLELVYVSGAWFLTKLIYGTIYKYLISQEYKTDFKNLSPWQKIMLSYFLYFSLFWAFVLLSFILS